MIVENFKGIDVNFAYDYIMGCLAHRNIYTVANPRLSAKDLTLSRRRGLRQPPR